MYEDSENLPNKDGARPEPAIRKRDLLDYWDNLSTEKLRGDRQTLIRTMADRFDVSEEIIKKMIADWEAGKNGPLAAGSAPLEDSEKH